MLKTANAAVGAEVIGAKPDVDKTTYDTYSPHSDHDADLEKLHKCVVRAVEAMGLRVVDGVDVGGRPLDDALRKRIEDADGLVALAPPSAFRQPPITRESPRS